VSPWLREELRVLMCPGHVTLLPVRRTLTLRGLRRTLYEPQTMLLQGATEAQPWRAALLALEGALQRPAKGRTAATVILSNQFLRYALVPWRAGLADAQEDLSYARHCFTKVYGKAALQWELRLSRQALEMPRVAAAVDPELLDGLRSVCQRAGIGLRSVQPHLMAGFNSAKRHLRQRSAWLALLEPGHLCLALLRDGQWSRVRNIRLEGSWREEFPPILEREAFLVDDPVPHEVWVGHMEDADLVLPEIDSWQVHALAAGPAACAASVEGAAHLTMAMAG
jgi:hypothetical protein